ncbi:hypothetical protein [Ruegeria lacuscaerulensis]|uniref:hypothetical protein n=1 Tax=Ruegeria lacuscaerulensis TaxID=55218 RepID=UPI00147B5CBF|nr:hypothetical protein [Ruegeria lacuscaerulensis]
MDKFELEKQADRLRNAIDMIEGAKDDKEKSQGRALISKVGLEIAKSEDGVPGMHKVVEQLDPDYWQMVGLQWFGIADDKDNIWQ